MRLLSLLVIGILLLVAGCSQPERSYTGKITDVSITSGGYACLDDIVFTFETGQVVRAKISPDFEIDITKGKYHTIVIQSNTVQRIVK